MKKLSLLLLAFIALFSACKKNNDTVRDTPAHVRYSDPALDGIGYYILLDGTGEPVIPINLPSGYRHSDVDEAVAVKLIDVGKRFHLGFTDPNSIGLRGVYIVTIRKI